MLVGCGGDSTNIPTFLSSNLGIYQNPFMSPNPRNNMHNDTYMTDSYLTAGPTTASKYSVRAGFGPVHRSENRAASDRINGRVRCAVF